MYIRLVWENVEVIKPGKSPQQKKFWRHCFKKKIKRVKFETNYAEQRKQ